jgi:hypothetical protein
LRTWLCWQLASDNRDAWSAAEFDRTAVTNRNLLFVVTNIVV